MIERSATIASIFAEAAGELGIEVTIARAAEPADEAVDADSMLALMSLGVEYGELVVLRTEDDTAAKALESLVRILETNHDA